MHSMILKSRVTVIISLKKAIVPIWRLIEYYLKNDKEKASVSWEWKGNRVLSGPERGHSLVVLLTFPK